MRQTLTLCIWKVHRSFLFEDCSPTCWELEGGTIQSTHHPGLFRGVERVRVDFVSAEAQRCAEGGVRYLERGPDYQYKHTRLISGHNVRYVVPNQIDPRQEVLVFLRPLIVGRDVYLTVKADGHRITRKKYHQVQPSEMIQIPLTSEEIIGNREIPTRIEVSLEREA